MQTRKSDPREFKFPVRLARGEGSATIRAGAIKDVSRYSLAEIRITTVNGSIMYLEDQPHLLTDLLRKQVQCIEYAEAEAEAVGRTIS